MQEWPARTGKDAQQHQPQGSELAASHCPHLDRGQLSRRSDGSECPSKRRRRRKQALSFWGWVSNVEPGPQVPQKLRDPVGTDPASLTPPRDTKAHVHVNASVWMLTATLFTPLKSVLHLMNEQSTSIHMGDSLLGLKGTEALT